MQVSRALLIGCILAALSASAQSAALSASAQSTDTAQELKQAKAYALVEDALRDAQELRSPENKLVIYSKAAGLLWNRDPKRARELYSRLTALYQQVMVEPKQSGTYGGNPGFQLRQVVANEMAQHEPEMALDFVRQTSSGGNSQMEMQLTAAIANQLARSKPKEAEKLVEANLAHGDFSTVSQMIAYLPSMDKEAAANLVDNTVTRIEKAAADGEEQAMYAATNLLQMDDGRSPKTKILNDAQRRSLADSAINLLSIYSRPVETFDPSSAALLQKNAPSAWQAFITKASEQRQSNGESTAVAQFHAAFQRNALDVAFAAVELVPAGQRG